MHTFHQYIDCEKNCCLRCSGSKLFDRPRKVALVRFIYASYMLPRVNRVLVTASALVRRASYPGGRICLRATISSCVSANRDSVYMPMPASRVQFTLQTNFLQLYSNWTQLQENCAQRLS